MLVHQNSINAIAGAHNSDNKPITITWRSVPTSPDVLVTQVFTMTGRVSWDQKFSPGEPEFSGGEAEFSSGEAGKCFHNFLHFHMVIPLLIRALRHHTSSSLLFKAPWISGQIEGLNRQYYDLFRVLSVFVFRIICICIYQCQFPSQGGSIMICLEWAHQSPTCLSSSSATLLFIRFYISTIFLRLTVWQCNWLIQLLFALTASTNLAMLD